MTRTEAKMIATELYQLAKKDLIEAVVSMNEEVLTTHQAAKFLRCSERQLRRLVAEGEIPFSKPNGRLVFYRSKLTTYLDRKSRQ